LDHFTGAQVCDVTRNQPLCQGPLLPSESAPDFDALPATEVSGSFVATPAPPFSSFGG
jgi:hypothetical protein